MKIISLFPRRNRKVQRLLTILLLFFLSLVCSVYSTSETFGNKIGSTPRPQGIPLPPNTNSVKCQCKAIIGEHDLHEEREEIKNVPENIEIDIFPPVEDLKSSKINRRQDDQNMQDSPDAYSFNNNGNSFKAYKSIHLFGRNIITPHTSADLLLLGTMQNPFEGPRRKRDLNGNNKVLYVYPEKYNVDLRRSSENQFVPQVQVTNVKVIPSSPSQSVHEFQVDPNVFSYNENPTMEATDFTSSRDKLSRRDFKVHEPAAIESYNNDPLKYKDIHLNKAMQSAWEQYGPKSSLNKQISIRSQLQGYSGQGQGSEIRQTPWTTKDSFQQMGSEWDSHMTEIPVPVFDRDVVKPGMFSPILTRYIDFEVNNHEVSDFMRKFVFGLFIGTLVIGWIALGLLVGAFPIHWLFKSARTNTEISTAKRNSEDAITEIADRIMLSLDSDWLKELEKRIKRYPTAQKITTHARCCISPNLKTNGVVDCQLIRKRRADESPVKCLSDLIYNFEFGEESNQSS